jgi:hypothetical protein
MSAAQREPGTRADWYSDPGNPNQIRFWDGSQWSIYTLPKPPMWDKSPVASSSRWRRWGVAAAAIILLLGVVGAMTGDGDSAANEAGRATADKPSAVAEPTPAVATRAPKPTKAAVPSVVGLSSKKAQSKLAAAGLVAAVVDEIPSPRPRGTVLRQLTKAGVKVRRGTTVALEVAALFPMVPRTAGTTVAVATQRLRSAGFRVAVTKEIVTSGREGVVLRQSPVGTLRARPHSVVTLVVASVVRPVAPPPSNCTPGYSPGLTPASDYDCAGGSGDGPGYVYGIVHVTGSDPYDLDRDGDGVACES